MTKIYGHAAKGRDHLLEKDKHGFFVHEVLNHASLIGHVLEDGSMYFVAIPSRETVRDELAAIPGVTVFDSHLSPSPIKPEHHAILKQHGAQPHHTMWQAIELMLSNAAPDKLRGRWDPNN